MMRSLYSIFCDDIRPEVGNKFSYMGCYIGQMYLPTLPLTLPKLCVAMNAHTPASKPFKHLKFRLLKFDEVIAETDMNFAEGALPPMPWIQSPGDELRIMVGQIFQLPAFHIAEPCVLRVRAFTEEEEELKGGSLAIAVAPVPAAV